MLLGTTPAASKVNFTTWLDAVVSSVATEDVFVYDHRRQRVEGHYTGLRNNKYQTSISKLSGLSEWAAQCTTNRISCGTLLVISIGGRGSTTSVPILCGPFQKRF